MEQAELQRAYHAERTRAKRELSADLLPDFLYVINYVVALDWASKQHLDPIGRIAMESTRWLRAAILAVLVMSSAR